MLSPEDDSNFESERVSYMFRCASTYNWYALNDYCSTFLISYHGSAMLKTRKSMLKIIRKELLFTDQWGNTVLHAACFQQPPLNVVEMILNMGRHASVLLDLVSRQSRDGSTALLVACATGASSAVIQALLLSTSPSTTTTSQPLLKENHAPTFQQQQQQESQTNKPQNNNEHDSQKHQSWLPLLPDNHGATPLSELCNQYHIMRKSSSGVKPIPPILTDVSSAEDLVTFPVLRLFWEKVNLILEASIPLFATTTTPSDTKNNPSFVVNAMASVSHICPVILSSLICKIYPQCLFSQRSKYAGLLPLHQAISISVSLLYIKNNNHILLTHPAQQKAFQEQQTTLICRYAEIYPTAARRAVPITIISNNRATKYWRTPFCHAIMAGFTWNNFYPFSTSFRSNNFLSPQQTSSNDNDTKYKSVLQCLAKHAPEAIDCRDAVTGLYPFILAATVTLKTISTTTTADINHHDDNSMDQDYLDLAQLDNIYNLLLNSPQLLVPSTLILT